MSEHTTAPLWEPKVVLDWNIIQTASIDCLSIPKTIGLLIADEAIYEIALKQGEAGETAGQADTQLRRLITFCDKFRDQIWAATPANWFMNCGRRINMEQVLHPEATRMLRERHIRPEVAAREMLDACRSSDLYQQFLQARSRWLEITRRTRPLVEEKLASNEPERIARVRSKELLDNILRPDELHRLGIEELRSFPDALPFARWMRLSYWYCMRSTALVDTEDATQQIMNDFADANYAFLASYTGHLATNDGGCQKAVRAICPHVKIWTLDLQTRALREAKTTPAA